MSINLDEASGSKGKWFSFANVGDTFTGTFLSADERQKTDYGTGAPLTWDDGKPIIEYVMEFQTALRDTDDDTGQRTIYCGKSSRLFRAMDDARKTAGLKWADGPQLTIKRDPDGDPVTLKNGKKGNAPHCFRAKAVRPAPVSSVNLDDDLI